MPRAFKRENTVFTLLERVSKNFENFVSKKTGRKTIFNSAKKVLTKVMLFNISCLLTEKP